jgi:Tol biopolymer transport system component/predicted Ser/Thr protein kinase
MSLSPGHRLGAYEILSPLGAGGMGEVYRARDTRLGRDVAIKVLPTDRLTDQGRRRRFVQEARAASALNHPNIVTIHEIESADGADFIVMEYVPGKTLDALMRQRMRLAEALRVAVPIADALARAHAAGIVHRDLKPANVVVTPEGVVKVLDFGLAKLMDTGEVSDEGDTATQDSSAAYVSGPGTIAGTPGYMSPEQASGARIDARSDIFAFGSLLYEMATGRRAFAGGSRAETLAAVLQAQPQPPSTLVADLPRDLEKLILRCLRKQPEKRFQHMADVKVLLDEIQEDEGSAQGAAAPAVPRQRRALLLTAALALVLVAGASLAVRRLRQAPPPPPQVIPLTATSGSEAWPTFSPDGNQIAFQWDGEVTEGASPLSRDSDIWLKLIGSSETRKLTTGPGLDCCPSWSPDGREIAYIRHSVPDVRFTAGPSGRIHVVSPLGGAERQVSDFAAVTSSLAWSPDGRWLVASAERRPGDTTPGAGALHLISLETGETRAITTPQPLGYDSNPALSPDGTRLAYASCGFWWLPPCDVQAVSLGADLVPRGAPRRLVRLTERVWSVAWSRDGRSVLYSAVPNTFNKGRLWRVDAAGDRPPGRLELAPQGAVFAAVSPLQDRLAFTLERGGYASIYRFETGRSPSVALGATPGGDTSPSFSPDGRRIAFMSARAGEGMEIWLADASGSNPVQLTRGPGSHQGSPRFSPDGRRIVFEARGEDGFADVWTIDAAGGPPRRVTDGRFHNGRASWSRDGRFLYYREDRAEGRDIVRIPEGGGTPERVTRNGGYFARLSADDRWLFYTKTDPTSPLFRLELPDGPEQRVVDCVQSVSLESGPDGLYYAGCTPDRSEAAIYRLDAASGRPRLLGRLPAANSVIAGLAVSPDGRTILFASQLPRSADLMLIENFR